MDNIREMSYLQTRKDVGVCTLSIGRGKRLDKDILPTKMFIIKSKNNIPLEKIEQMIKDRP